eukprot:gene20788-22826_t
MPKDARLENDFYEQWVTIPYPEDIAELLIDLDADKMEDGSIDLRQEIDFSDDDDDV